MLIHLYPWTKYSKCWDHHPNATHQHVLRLAKSFTSSLLIASTSINVTNMQERQEIADTIPWHLNPVPVENPIPGAWHILILFFFFPFFCWGGGESCTLGIMANSGHPYWGIEVVHTSGSIKPFFCLLLLVFQESLPSICLPELALLSFQDPMRSGLCI